jgi:hypothetical protein
VITVTVTDDVGVATVLLWVQNPGANGYTSRPMTLGQRNRYSVVVDAVAEQMTYGTLRYFFTAADAAGNSARLPILSPFFVSYYTLPVNPCIT